MRLVATTLNKSLHLIALTLATIPSLFLAGPSWAQEIPELSLSIPAGRFSTNIPVVELIPLRNEASPKSQSGWVLVYRNLVRQANASNTDVHSRAIGAQDGANGGSIAWEITHTTNNNCQEIEDGCPDEIRILSVPEGYMAVPERALVNERDGLRIYIVPILVG